MYSKLNYFLAITFLDVQNLNLCASAFFEVKLLYSNQMWSKNVENNTKKCHEEDPSSEKGGN